MKRRAFLFGTVTGIAAAPFSRLQADEPARHQPVPFAFDKPVDHIVKSNAVTWRKNDYHLVQFHRALFSLDKKTSQLSAKLTGRIMTFDDVVYDVSGAVFGANGELLGSARSKCKVSRHWLGRPTSTAMSLVLDFGSSRAFAKAKTFLLGISDQPVLTPDQWQKD